MIQSKGRLSFLSRVTAPLSCLLMTAFSDIACSSATTPAAAGTGGESATGGGTSDSGGSFSTGGAESSGGSTSSGGSVSTGGSQSSGGAEESGGTSASGGSTAANTTNDADVKTPEGCDIGQTCSCTAGVGVCQGGSLGTSCTTATDCPTKGSLCLTNGSGNICFEPCNKQGGCGAAACPSGFTCSTLLPGEPKVCSQTGAFTPPVCQTVADCTTLPGSSCVNSGFGMYCLLPCT